VRMGRARGRVRRWGRAASGRVQGCQRARPGARGRLWAWSGRAAAGVCKRRFDHGMARAGPGEVEGSPGHGGAALRRPEGEVTR
jgi:hypothetical protein